MSITPVSSTMLDVSRCSVFVPEGYHAGFQSCAVMVWHSNPKQLEIFLVLSICQASNHAQ